MADRVPFLRAPFVDCYPSGGVCEASSDSLTLFVLGGMPPNPLWLRRFYELNSPSLWVVDSGVEVCRQARLVPCAIVGDGDSASGDAWAWAASSGAREYRYSSDKDLTDFQLAMDHWYGHASSVSSSLVLTGCFGGRLDHLFSVLHSFAFAKKACSSSRSLCMIDDREGLFLLYSGESVGLCFRERPCAVSLLPLTDICRGVSIEGVKWPLNDVVLERGFPWAISNEALRLSEDKGVVNVQCADGVLAVYWCMKTNARSGPETARRLEG